MILPAPAAPPARQTGRALQTTNLTQQYDGRTVLHAVSLEVWPGEVVAVSGPSGSGKSTLLHLLGGLDRPTGGEVWWGDTRTDVLDTQARARLRASLLGLVFQHHYLLPDLNVLQNVLVPTMLVPGSSGSASAPSSADWPARARELLDRVGLGGRETAFPSVLSGGERQRVALARALVTRPAAVLADEPTGSLDRANTEAVADLLLALAREEGSGVLMVTHDDWLAGKADRQLHLLDGRWTDGSAGPNPRSA